MILSGRESSGSLTHSFLGIVVVREHIQVERGEDEGREVDGDAFRSPHFLAMPARLRGGPQRPQVSAWPCSLACCLCGQSPALKMGQSHLGSPAPAGAWML